MTDKEIRDLMFLSNDEEVTLTGKDLRRFYDMAFHDGYIGTWIHQEGGRKFILEPLGGSYEITR